MYVMPCLPRNPAAGRMRGVVPVSRTAKPAVASSRASTPCAEGIAVPDRLWGVGRRVAWLAAQAGPEPRVKLWRNERSEYRDEHPLGVAPAVGEPGQSWQGGQQRLPQRRAASDAGRRGEPRAELPGHDGDDGSSHQDLGCAAVLGLGDQPDRAGSDYEKV